MLLGHGTGICPLEVAGVLSVLASLGGVSGLVALLRSKLGF
jgi:hypothetical protein